MARERTGERKPASPRPQQAPPLAAEKGDNGASHNKPVYEARLGRVKAAVWANHGESGVWYSVVFSRIYKEGDAWKRSESFSRDDLPLVAKLADRVHTWIYEQTGAADGMTQ
jgi:hypothetical protein